MAQGLGARWRFGLGGPCRHGLCGLFACAILTRALEGQELTDVLALKVWNATDPACNALYEKVKQPDGRPVMYHGHMRYASTTGAVIYFHDFWKMNCKHVVTGWIYSAPEAVDSLPPSGEWTAFGFNPLVDDEDEESDVQLPHVAVQAQDYTWRDNPEAPSPDDDAGKYNQQLDCDTRKIPGWNGTMTKCDPYFRHIRDIFGFKGTVGDVLSKMGLRIVNGNLDDGHQAQKTTGKSQAAFYIRQEYILKSLTNQELARFEKYLVPAYLEHVVKFWRRSQITRVFALIVTSAGTTWMLMHNWIPIHDMLPMYDLKGSTTGRTAGLGKFLLKDNDWTNRGMMAELPEEVRRLHIGQLARDVSGLFRKFGFIDYSIIYGQTQFGFPAVGRCQDAIVPICLPNVPCFDAGWFAYRKDLMWARVYDYFCDDGKAKVHIGHPCIGSVYHEDNSEVRFTLSCWGLIDFLKKYDLKAKAERAIKGRGASVKRPAEYEERFMNFMRGKVFSGNSTTALSKQQVEVVRFEVGDGQCLAWGVALGKTEGDPPTLCGKLSTDL